MRKKSGRPVISTIGRVQNERAVFPVWFSQSAGAMFTLAVLPEENRKIRKTRNFHHRPCVKRTRRLSGLVFSVRRSYVHTCSAARRKPKNQEDP